MKINIHITSNSLEPTKCMFVKLLKKTNSENYALKNCI